MPVSVQQRSEQSRAEQSRVRWLDGVKSTLPRIFAHFNSALCSLMPALIYISIALILVLIGA